MREQQILHKIKKGDQQTLNNFIQDLYPYVYSFTYRKMQGDDSAKDITQEVFVRFIRQLPMYHAQGKTLHYLYRIASNLCHDYHRKMQRDLHTDIDRQENLISADSDVHEVILDQIRNEELMYYIGELSDSQQDVILLKYYHQMTFKEIAQSFSIPVSTVKTRHTAALKRLCALWKEGGYHETILLCQKEQEQYIQKNCTSLLQLILRYMWLDFRFYMILSIIGLLISILLITLDAVNAQIYTAIYFFILGISALYEYYKCSHYRMLDIISPVYLNPCRAFLIRTAGIALNGLVMSFILLVIFILKESWIPADFIMTGIVPLYAMQIIFTHLIHRIKGYISALAAYSMFYCIYLFIYSQYIRYMISNPQAVLVILIVSCLTLFNMRQLNKGMSDTERRQQKWSWL